MISPPAGSRSSRPLTSLHLPAMHFKIYIPPPDSTGCEIANAASAVVVAEGVLNSHTSAEAQRFLQKQVQLDVTAPRHVLIDAARLEYLNSSGLRVLAQIARDLRKTGRKLALCGAADPLRELVEVSGLAGLILKYESVAAAREALFE
ncbi:hypothetical protein DB346_18990 [Verrucomicrobia bacterium LW23]|nr:hypothetical protein DB346_18990 [Verrucomicrobia bacterium LW23]